MGGDVGDLHGGAIEALFGAVVAGVDQELLEVLGGLLGVAAGIPAVDIRAMTDTGVVLFERHRPLLGDDRIKVLQSLVDGHPLDRAGDGLAVLQADGPLPKHRFRGGVGVGLDAVVDSHSYLSGTNFEERVAPIPACPCSTELRVSWNSPR